jgi:hypothetical protein
MISHPYIYESLVADRHARYEAEARARQLALTARRASRHPAEPGADLVVLPKRGSRQATNPETCESPAA